MRAAWTVAKHRIPAHPLLRLESYNFMRLRSLLSLTVFACRTKEQVEQLRVVEQRATKALTEVDSKDPTRVTYVDFEKT